MKYVETREIPLDRIEVNAYHLRDETNDKRLELLARSIDKIGLVHPIVVRATPNDERPYTLVAGERRFLAHQKLGRNGIRADVWEANASEASEPDNFRRAAEMMTIVSNVQVEPLHLFEMGRRFLKWADDFGMKDEEIAETLDVPVTLVREAIAPVKNIAPEALQLIEQNIDKVERRHIDLLADEATRTTPEGQMRIVRKIINQEDRELVTRPAKLTEVAVSVRREIRNERKQREATSAPSQRPAHTDEFKRKKLFDFIRTAEESLAGFRVAEVPEALSLVDLKSLEARGERLGRAWPQVVKELLTAVEAKAAAGVAQQTDTSTNPEPQHDLQQATV